MYPVLQVLPKGKLRNFKNFFCPFSSSRSAMIEFCCFVSYVPPFKVCFQNVNQSLVMSSVSQLFLKNSECVHISQCMVLDTKELLCNSSSGVFYIHILLNQAELSL